MTSFGPRFIAVVVLLVLCTCCIGALLLTGTVGRCDELTRLICTSDAIRPGDSYIWSKGDPPVTLTNNEYNGQTYEKKYRGKSGNRNITLDIFHTNNTDAGKYTCSHGFNESNVIELTQPCSNSGAPSKPTFGFLVILVMFIMKGRLEYFWHIH